MLFLVTICKRLAYTFRRSYLRQVVGLCDYFVVRLTVTVTPASIATAKHNDDARSSLCCVHEQISSFLTLTFCLCNRFNVAIDHMLLFDHIRRNTRILFTLRFLSEHWRKSGAFHNSTSSICQVVCWSLRVQSATWWTPVRGWAEKASCTTVTILTMEGYRKRVEAAETWSAPVAFAAVEANRLMFMAGQIRKLCHC